MSDNHQHSEHHIASTGMYITIFVILMVCTVLTYYVWTIDLGVMNIVAALGIAIVKATLVIRYFMHIKWSPILSKMAVVTAITFLGILLVLVSMDYSSRHLQNVQGWEKYQVLKN